MVEADKTEVLNAIQVIGQTSDAALLENSPVAARSAQWREETAVSMAAVKDRGLRYVTKLHGDPDVVANLDAYGTADLGMVVSMCYGYLISDVAILDESETSLAFLAALVAQQVSHVLMSTNHNGR